MTFTIDDYRGRRVVIVNGKYRSRKGNVYLVYDRDVYVDIDSIPLRVVFDVGDIRIIDIPAYDKQ